MREIDWRSDRESCSGGYRRIDTSDSRREKPAFQPARREREREMLCQPFVAQLTLAQCSQELQ